MTDISTGRFGDRLRRYRVNAGLSQEALAERAGISARGISDLERGVNRTPQRETVLRLADALDLGGDEREAFVAAAQRRAAGSHPDERIERDQPHSLPVPLTALLGRDEEVQALFDLLCRRPRAGAPARLATLTGPGGVGKTRLALAVAANLVTEFPDGVIFIPLASLGDAGLVPAVLAQSVGLRAEGGHPIAEDLAAHLHAKRLLLVVDNFEHLLPAAPELARLLEACPQLAMLVTSRATLHLRGEREVPVAPLALPDLQHLPAPDALTRYPAIALFVERIREHHPAFALGGANAATVAEVCARLDGLPLALELAAAQIRLFSPRALLARLERRLAILTGGPRDLPARQQTMRATIAWSYDLLQTGEQTLFRRLAVFAGGCTLEAIEAVSASNGAPDDDVLEWLRSLADKNLLYQLDEADSEPRFAMLETIREYAMERLTSAGELDAARLAHARHFQALAEHVEAQLNGPEQLLGRAKLEQDHANLRAALQWSIHERGDLALGLRLACGLGRFWLMSGYYREGLGWLELALALCAPADGEMRATALSLVGHLAFWLGDLDRCQVAYTESLELRRSEGDTSRIAVAVTNLGNVAFERADYDRAQVLWEEGMVLSRQAGDLFAWARALNNMGVLAQIRGDLVQALSAYEQCAQFWRERGDTWSLAQQLTNMGDVVALQGKAGPAYECYRQSLISRRAQGDRDGAAWTLRSLGYLAHHLGNDRYAARVHAAASSLAAELGSGVASHLRGFHERQIEEIGLQLGKAAFDAAWGEGQSMTVDQAIAYALDTQMVVPLTAEADRRE